MTAPDDSFGVCPECGRHDGYYNAGKGHWFVCHEHELRWFVGSNLFSSWRTEDPLDQEFAHSITPGWGRYEEVDAELAAA